MMTHRVNAIVEQQSKLGFGSGEYWSTLPPEPVYVTDEFGKTVADYDEEARKAGGSTETAMEEDVEQETPYTVATTQVRVVERAPAKPEPFEREVIDKYGQAVFKAQQDLQARIGQINAEINRIFKEAQENEKKGLAGVAEEAARKAAVAEIDKKYQGIRVKIEGLLASYNAARHQLDLVLYTEQTKQTTKSALEALYVKYCVDTGQLLDTYVSGVKNLLTG
jgi:chromosome segregation ATPase